jgi:hypothetical protein
MANDTEELACDLRKLRDLGLMHESGNYRDLQLLVSRVAG